MICICLEWVKTWLDPNSHWIEGGQKRAVCDVLDVDDGSGCRGRARRAGRGECQLRGRLRRAEERMSTSWMS
eukprot:scaffold911_cov162-Ochromonas_danica.AAC.18